MLWIMDTKRSEYVVLRNLYQVWKIGNRLERKNSDV